MQKRSDHGEDGDELATARFRNGRSEEELVVGVLPPPGLVGAVEGVEEVEAVRSVVSAEPEELHGGVSATRSLCSLSGIFRRRRRGQRGEETMAARGRKERGELGFGAAPRGWL